MVQDVSTTAQQAAIDRLMESAGKAERQQAELVHAHEQERVAADAEFLAAQKQMQQHGKQKLDALNTELSEQLETARLSLEQQLEELEKIRSTKTEDAVRRRTERVTQAQQDCEATLFQLADHVEQDRSSTREKHDEFLKHCSEASSQLEIVREATQTFWDRRGWEFAEEKVSVGSPTDWSSTLLRRSVEARQQVEEQLGELRRLATTRFLDEGWWLPFVMVVLLGGAFVVGFRPNFWWPIVALVTLLATWLALQVTSLLLRRTLRRVAPEMERQLGEAAGGLRAAQAAAQREMQATLAQIDRHKEDQTTAAQQEMNERIQHAQQDLKAWRKDLEIAYQRRCQELETAWEHETDEIGNRYSPLIQEERLALERREQELAERHQQQVETIDSNFRQAQEQLRADWTGELTAFCHFAQAAREAAASAMDWDTLDVQAWTPPAQPADAIPLGSYNVPWPAAISLAAEGTILEDNGCRLPILMSFPHQASLVLKVRDEGRAAAIGVLQQAMLGLLTSVPAGKIRFTIIDPTGLGQNFSAFMHLADYDERLVGHRIWTEAAHINQRLADLTEHMENVIQKYLRNQFDSIQHYNETAGEVAEPFRVLVVANFPAHFSEEATRRLISIANSGPRCGVYTLISIDLASRMPRHVQWSDLEANANVLVWEQDRFRWQTETLAPWELSLTPPPDDPSMTALIQAAGRHAKQSSRVEVPFSFVAPDPSQRWTFDSNTGVDIPLGQAGATHRMALKLGQGTSQHVLIAGKTGSGKSTLLHALITNAALHYPPDQLQLYLVDFKKGVEFKPYAEHRLPHARVIAIESEREFGLSVLQRLDQELRWRGDLFREAGVQSLAHFRQIRSQQTMPRILLIVDEFQEFFVNDDKIAHEASLLLDRLVRQGRAFGMHVILGSQTLAGAYSLARSTIGQMAVRIALQCSSADAHLILSEDNTAARLLGRPGEAIYNDANGLLEGNHPFQVVWLSDEQRSKALRQISELSTERALDLPPPIIFEGHTSARLEQNDQLAHRIESGPTALSALSPTAWLGAAVAIKDPTAVAFRRQSAQNLLIVGQNEQAAQGVLCSSILSLAAERPADPDARRSRAVTFHLLDGLLNQPVPDGLSSFLLENADLDLQIAGPSGTTETIHTIAEAIEQRQQTNGTTPDPIFLVIYDLARFSQLQSELDDFGLPSFGDRDQPASPAAELAVILRDGPSVGVHTLIWADNYNNLSRWFQRPQLRDFGYRVLFQMSAVDSSQLMDSTAASVLGGHRAILYQDASGEAERFRPYQLPTVEWMGELRETWSKTKTAESPGTA